MSNSINGSLDAPYFYMVSFEIDPADVQGQQKTHTSLESVGFMFKVHRFGTLYFADVHEVSRLRNPLISLDFYWWRFTDSNRGPVDYDEKVY
jgi:hypothetical protein